MRAVLCLATVMQLSSTGIYSQALGFKVKHPVHLP